MSGREGEGECVLGERKKEVECKFGEKEMEEYEERKGKESEGCASGLEEGAV